jgi:hypothetical protein
LIHTKKSSLAGMGLQLIAMAAAIWSSPRPCEGYKTHFFFSFAHSEPGARTIKFQEAPWMLDAAEVFCL